MHDQQDVGVLRHSIQHRGEFGQLHLERVEFLAHTPARMLQRLDQLAGALVARRTEIYLLGTVGRGGSGDDEERCAFEQDGLGGAAGLGEGRQMP